MSIFDNIKGFVPNSLVDWDGKVAGVIFLSNCNFRCNYCSNRELVLEPEKIKSIKFDVIKKILDVNKEFIDGIVVTGGEPTIYSDLPLLFEEIKKLGFKTKLDTNGSNPEMIELLIKNNLLDFIAMDIKTSFNKYKQITNSEIDLDKIKKSIEMISNFNSYEFRLTFLPEIKKQDLVEIAEYLKEHRADKAFFLQKFRPENCINPEMEKTNLNDKEIENAFDSIKNYFTKTGIRN